MWSSGCEELVEAFLRRICRASEWGVEVVSVFSSDVASTSAATQQPEAAEKRELWEKSEPPLSSLSVVGSSCVVAQGGRTGRSAFRETTRSSNTSEPQRIYGGGGVVLWEPYGSPGCLRGGDRVRLVDWPQAVLSDWGQEGGLLMGRRSLSAVCGEVMLIQRTLRAGGEPRAAAHPRATEHCCGEPQSCGQLQPPPHTSCPSSVLTQSDGSRNK
ncbi:hypothetical protein JOQ06_029339, partial [Pogonophryne albipinna]